MANHGFSGHRERRLDEVKEQNLVIRSQKRNRLRTVAVAHRVVICVYQVRWTEKGSWGNYGMTTKALFVKLEAKPGKENEVAKFLRDGQGLVAQEPATTAWFGLRLGQTSFAIFDAFPDDAGRDAHLSGNVAKALMEKAPELLAEPPKIEKADVLADRLPG